MWSRRHAVPLLAEGEHPRRPEGFKTESRQQPSTGARRVAPDTEQRRLGREHSSQDRLGVPAKRRSNCEAMPWRQLHLRSQSRRATRTIEQIAQPVRTIFHPFAQGRANPCGFSIPSTPTLRKLALTAFEICLA